MTKIGFISNKKTNGGRTHKVEDKDCFLRFDSGTTISIDDAFHHTIILGTTGSGKTSNVVLPILSNVFEKGMCGLVIDIKGNMREKITPIAKANGREKDLIELGISSTATPLNFIANMNQSQLFDFLKALCSTSFEGKTHSFDFHIRGVKQATECVELLSLLAEDTPDYAPNLDFLGQMLNNYSLASKLFDEFISSVFKDTNKEHVEFKERIMSSDFHILQYNQKSKNDFRNHYSDQVNYAIGAIRTALFEFMNVPGLIENFAQAGAPGIDMKEMILQNKIVVLRFDPDSGSIGAGLARSLIEKYYESIFLLGEQEATKHPSFICLDEFQEVVNLSESRFSDKRFIGIAREYKACFIASTQSVAALVKNDLSYSDVSAFISNCNNRIIFYSDDIYTQKLVTNLDRYESLIDLMPGQAFVSRYEHSTREHKHGVETLQNSYESTSTLMKNNTRKVVSKKVVYQRVELLDLLPKKKETEDTKEEIKPNQKQTVTSLFRGKQSDEEKQEKEPEKAEIVRTEFEKRIIADFPECLDLKDDLQFDAPKGWQDTIYKVFKAFKTLDLDISIYLLGIINGKAYVSAHYDKRSKGTPETVFNELLNITNCVCIFCGSIGTGQSSRVRVCPECLQKFGLYYEGEIEQ